MSLNYLKEKALVFLKDRSLAEKWVHTPVDSFEAPPAEHYSSSVKAQKEIESYLDSLIDKWS